MNNIVSGTTTAISVLLGLGTYNLLIKYYLNEIYANKSFIFIIKMLQFIH